MNIFVVRQKRIFVPKIFQKENRALGMELQKGMTILHQSINYEAHIQISHNLFF